MPNPYLSAFNSQFEQFLDDISRLFPDDLDLIASKKSLIFMKKFNPRLIITTWRDLIAKPYESEIENNGLDFFISKDYTNDLKSTSDSENITAVINRLRTPLKNLQEDDKATAMKYISNLTKLSLRYE
jgi:hypothetical protein